MIVRYCLDLSGFVVEWLHTEDYHTEGCRKFLVRRFLRSWSDRMSYHCSYCHHSYCFARTCPHFLFEHSYEADLHFSRIVVVVSRRPPLPSFALPFLYDFSIPLLVDNVIFISWLALTFPCWSLHIQLQLISSSSLFIPSATSFFFATTLLSFLATPTFSSFRLITSSTPLVFSALFIYTHPPFSFFNEPNPLPFSFSRPIVTVSIFKVELLFPSFVFKAMPRRPFSFRFPYSRGIIVFVFIFMPVSFIRSI